MFVTVVVNIICNVSEQESVSERESPLGVFHVVVLYFFPSGVRMNMKLLLLLHSPTTATTHSNVIVLHVVICLNRGEGVREREWVSKCRLCFCVCVYGKFDT